MKKEDFYKAMEPHKGKERLAIADILSVEAVIEQALMENVITVEGLVGMLPDYPWGFACFAVAVDKWRDAKRAAMTRAQIKEARAELEQALKPCRGDVTPTDEQAWAAEDAIIKALDGGIITPKKADALCWECACLARCPSVSTVWSVNREAEHMRLIGVDFQPFAD